MKAIMSDKLRNMLNHPQDARELQKLLVSSNSTKTIEKIYKEQKNQSNR